MSASALEFQGADDVRYPRPSTSATTDDYHGTKVSDPYRPLEDLDSAETRAWVEAENRLTEGYLAAVPERAALNERLKTLWDYEKYSAPTLEGGRYFYTYNTGLQNQAVLYASPARNEPGKPILDPNTLSSDGTVALSGLSISKKGGKIAYALAEAGSDWTTWKVRDVDTAQDTGDKIRWSKFSSAEWVPDGSGFFYGRFPEPQPGADLKAANYFQKLYFHKLGTAQTDDTLIWKDDANKQWRADPTVTDDGAYLLLSLGQGTDHKYRVLWRPLDRPDQEPRHLVGDFDHDYSFIDNDGPRILFQTDDDASRGRVIAIDVNHPARTEWKEIIPEAAETLVSVTRVGNQLIANYLKDAHSQVRVFDLEGKVIRELALPELGTAAGFRGDRESRETFFTFTSFSRPASVYRYDVASGEVSLWKAPRLAFDPGDYETRQVFYQSKDGTRIPLFLCHKKGVTPNPEMPCLLYGYGGFNIAITPSFSPTNLAWMEQGGLFAVANLRGGAEYGESWHQGGTKLNKQNVFDDFIAAAEWLIAQKYTSTPRLAIEGRSNGGLLVGACMTQRPELYGATLPGVGVLDMLRFHKFTIGWAWIDDYGSSDNAEQFAALYKYSPLHNVKPGTCYPPTLITTGDHDDRVFPAHSFKFAAALQAAQACANPVLIRIETRAGHGAGKPTAKQIEESTDKLAFLFRALKISARNSK